jgi:hypothetical protein
MTRICPEFTASDRIVTHPDILERGLPTDRYSEGAARISDQSRWIGRIARI